MSSAISPPQRAIVTIATNDRVFWSRALFATVRAAYGHERTCIMYLVGDPPPGVTAETLGLELIRAEDLGIDAFWDMAFRYTAFEFATALKPRILEHALEVLGFDEVIYLDSDIIVASRLDEVDQALSAEACMVTTSHITAPHEGDFRSTNLMILRAGRLNSGFLTVRRDLAVASFLTWWGQTLETESKIELSEGYFVDQSWLQYAPSFVDGCIEIRHHGYNVGHWNLAQRLIRFSDGHYLVGDAPLRFFHRSGANLETPDGISRYAPRFRRTEHEMLGKLLNEHDQHLTQSRQIGATDLQGLDYSYGVFRDGSNIPLAWRRAYARANTNGQRPDYEELFVAGASPCNSTAENVPAYDGVVVSELIYEIWSNNLYLQRRFDINERAGQVDLCRWLSDQDAASRMRELEADLIARLDQIRNLEQRSRSLRWLLRSTLIELLRRVRWRRGT